MNLMMQKQISARCEYRDQPSGGGCARPRARALVTLVTLVTRPRARATLRPAFTHARGVGRLTHGSKPKLVGTSWRTWGCARPRSHILAFFWKVSRPPRAAQTPQIDDFPSVKKSYIQNLGVGILRFSWTPPRNFLGMGFWGATDT